MANKKRAEIVLLIPRDQDINLDHYVKYVRAAMHKARREMGDDAPWSQCKLTVEHINERETLGTCS